MNNQNKLLLVILGIVTLVTILFSFYSTWQTGRLVQLESRLQKEVVMRNLRIQMIDSQIERMTKDPAPQDYSSAQNTTQLYNYLSQTASTNQLQVIRINLNPIKPADGNVTPPMELVLAGNYQHTLNFVTDLHQLDKLELLTMDLTASDTDPTQPLHLAITFNLPTIREVRP